MDEPTNHLDVANVKWLQDYLVENTEITSLIVSHDSGFWMLFVLILFIMKTKVGLL